MSDKKYVINLINLERLKSLIDKKKSRKVIADKIGCDVSLITRHYNGERIVTIDYLKKYAEYFEVSSDYLLGLSDAPTSDKDLQFICDSTGLNIETINQLIELDNNNTLKSGYNIPLDIVGVIINQLVINQETCRFIKGELNLASRLSTEAKNNSRDISDRKQLVYDAEELFKNCLGEIYIIQNSINSAINKYFNFEDLQKEYNGFLEQKNHILNEIKKAGEDNEKE